MPIDIRNLMVLNFRNQTPQFREVSRLVKERSQTLEATRPRSITPGYVHPWIDQSYLAWQQLNLGNNKFTDFRTYKTFSDKFHLGKLPVENQALFRTELQQYLTSHLIRKAAYTIFDANLFEITNKIERWPVIKTFKNINYSVHPGVLQEFESIKNSETFLPRPDFIHDSGSEALPGIIKQGGLLALSELLKGSDLKTGEYYCYPNLSGKSLKLSDLNRDTDCIYASKGSLSNQTYSTWYWFDQYPVTFGISGPKQEQYTGDKIEEAYSDQGYSLGTHVPLENIVSAITPFFFKSTLQEALSGSGIPVISKEALDLHVLSRVSKK